MARHCTRSLATASCSFRLKLPHSRFPFRVSEDIAQAAFISFASCKLTIQQQTRHTMDLQEHCLNANGFDTVQDLYIGDSLLPADAQGGAKGAEVKRIELFDVPAIQGP